MPRVYARPSRSLGAATYSTEQLGHEGDFAGHFAILEVLKGSCGVDEGIGDRFDRT